LDRYDAAVEREGSSADGDAPLVTHDAP
jgi:hypothetical protein